MQKQIQKLVELQAVDVRLAALRRVVAGFPAKLAEIEARLAAAKKRLADAREAHTASLKDRKKFELDVEQWTEKARKYRDQSYEVKTNEAFRALQHEISNAETEVARAEDRLLERMVSGDGFDHQIKDAEAALKEAEAAAAKEKSALAGERAAEETKLAAAEAERAAIVAEIPEDLVGEYLRIAKTRGTALAEVRDETCRACGVRVRPHVYQELRRAGNDQVFHCETCGRILYYTEPAVPASLVAEVPPPVNAGIDAASVGSDSVDAKPPRPSAQATTGGQ